MKVCLGHSESLMMAPGRQARRESARGQEPVLKGRLCLTKLRLSLAARAVSGRFCLVAMSHEPWTPCTRRSPSPLCCRTRLCSHLAESCLCRGSAPGMSGSRRARLAQGRHTGVDQLLLGNLPALVCMDLALKVANLRWMSATLSTRRFVGKGASHTVSDGSASMTNLFCLRSCS